VQRFREHHTGGHCGIPQQTDGHSVITRSSGSVLCHLLLQKFNFVVLCSMPFMARVRYNLELVFIYDCYVKKKKKRIQIKQEKISP
jgi:hypothetical protein